MRAPGASCLVRIGRSFALIADSMYRVTTVAFDTSAFSASCSSNRTSFSTPARLAFISASCAVSWLMVVLCWWL